MVMPLPVIVVSKYLVSENRISILELNLKFVLDVWSFAAFFSGYSVLLTFLSQ
jgi:hypothetical protein